MLYAKRSLLAATLFAAVSAAATVYAGPFFTPPGPAPFAAIDADGDGYVTESEYQQFRSARQAARAAQGRMLRHAGQAPAFADWDSDSDGRLSPQELAAGQQARFQSRRAQWAGGPYGPGPRPCWRW